MKPPQFGERKLKILSCKPADKGIKCIIPEYNRVVWPDALDVETLRRRPTKKNPNPDVGTFVTLNGSTASFLFDDDSRRPKRYVLNKNGEVVMIVEWGLGRTYTVCSATENKLKCNVDPVLYEERVVKEGVPRKKQPKTPQGPPPQFENEMKLAAQELEERILKEHNVGAIVPSDLVPLKREGEIGRIEEGSIGPPIEIPEIYKGIHAEKDEKRAKIYRPLQDFVTMPELWGRYERIPEIQPGKHRVRKMKKGQKRVFFGGGKYPEGKEPKDLFPPFFQKKKRERDWRGRER